MVDLNQRFCKHTKSIILEEGEGHGDEGCGCWIIKAEWNHEKIRDRYRHKEHGIDHARH